jgi:hypothetical protein
MVRKKYNIHYFKNAALLATATISLFMMPHFNAFADTTVNVTADEMLTVKFTLPSRAASNVDPFTGQTSCTQPECTTSDGATFLLNVVGLNVSTNNENGFTASMTTETATTALTNEANSSYTIPIITANTTKANFPVNSWGFSTDDSTYKTIAPGGSSTPTYITSSNNYVSGLSQNLYFGAKANASQAAGTYSNTVIISVVSGVNTNNPTTPTDPVTPSDDDPTTDTTPTYITPSGGSTPAGSSNGATVYTRNRNTSSGNTTGTTVTAGNTTGSTYVSPAGVTTTAIVGEGTPLATGLAVTAGVAATAGIIFFIVAKRRRDDDEEEEDY